MPGLARSYLFGHVADYFAHASAAKFAEGESDMTSLALKDLWPAAKSG